MFSVHKFRADSPFRIFSSLGYLVIAIFSIALGCTTTKVSDTARTAKEQLLLSNSIDQALNKVDFRPFAGHAVFLDHQFLECVDKNYVVSSIRHRVLNAGGEVVDKAEDAEVILEARSGSVGTNNSETFIGVPEISLPIPVPISLPEVRLLTRATQTGIAKIGLAAYDAKTRRKLGAGGVSVAVADDNNWFVLGVGPFSDGSIHTELSESLALSGPHKRLPVTVAFEQPGTSLAEPSRLQLTAGEEASTEPAANAEN